MRLTIVAALPLLSLSAVAAEKHVRFEDLPAVVQKAAHEQVQSASIRGCSVETENGKTFYEVETRTSKGNRDLLFDADGKLVEVEQQVELSSLPAAAREGILKQAAGGTIRSVESVTRGNTVGYEAAVVKNGKHREVAINAEGKPVHD